MASPTLVRTRWIFPPPWTDRRRAEKAAMPMAWDAQHLIDLARESMVRGHYRVAMQRTVMVEAGGVALPQDLEDLVQRLWPALPRREQARIHALALSWAHFVRR